MITFKGRKNVPLIIAVVFLLIFAIVAACLSFSASQHQGIEELRKDAASRLKIFSGMIVAPTDKYSYLPKLVAEYPAIASALKHPHDARRISQANILLERLNSEAGATTVYVMNLDGLTIASSNWKEQESFIGNNYAFRPYFFEALSKGAGRFYAMGITTKVPGYYISHLVTKNKIKLGVVVVKVNISNLDIEWKNNIHEMVVTDERGIIFLGSRDDWKYRPLWGLTESEKVQLENTRQYEGVLKKALPIEIDEILGPEERIVRLITEKHWYGDERVSYFIKSQKLPSSEWAVYILSSLEEVNENARNTAFIAAGAVVLFVFLLLYLNQIRIRIRERKNSLLVLEQAHRVLEQKNNELRALNEELHLKSVTDPLTGLSNRRLFMESSTKLISAANRHHYPLSVIMVDVDRFKRINDTHGHDAGDKVLQMMATLLKEEMRETDALARFGGEEFVIALPHTNGQAACAVAERIRKKVMSHLIEADGKSLRVTISSGISEHRLGETNIEDIIKRADQALYEAKHRGRNRAVLKE